MPTLPVKIGDSIFNGLLPLIVVACNLPNEAVEILEPLMCPRLVTCIGLLKGPKCTELSENASMTGVPEIVFALNKLPLKLSLTLNNLPNVPSTAITSEPLPSTYKDAVVVPTILLALT